MSNIHRANLPLDFWWPKFSNAFFIISNTIEPGKDFPMETSTQAIKCFWQSLTNLLPNDTMRNLFQRFLNMDPDVVKTLKMAVPKFFQINPLYLTVLENQPYEFLDLCSKSQDSNFNYSYLLLVYITQTFINAGYVITLPIWSVVKNEFHKNNITKTKWGNALWFVIHTCAMYAPQPADQAFEDYKQLLTCLQFLLPCPKCRQHLSNNLRHINFESCEQNARGLFRCSWKLHNIVNESLDKRIYTFDEAAELYVPK